MTDSQPAYEQRSGWDGGSLRLGPFLVDTEGLLRPHDPAAAAPALSVRWRGRSVRAMLATTPAAAQATLSIELVAGRIPSTAASGSRPELRARAFDLARALPAHLPPGWQARLRPDHAIGVAATLSLPVPMHAADLLSGLSGFLLGLDPYLDEVDAATGRAADGTAKT